MLYLSGGSPGVKAERHLAIAQLNALILRMRQLDVRGTQVLVS